MKALGYITAGIITIVLQTLIGAYVAITLYHWFMLPVGAPNLSQGQLYGVMFFISYIRHRSDSDTPKDERSAGEVLAMAVFKGLLIGGLSLGFGWILHTIIY
jgi:hypothetical protein